ncbi:tRNA (guanosine(37)-N1)-methyltransferase TrmD [Roseiconus lacunae]|uniref:tRNA (guanine-N(1)-)-methyltransferase n=1 Tax=Roseiconus lacunae TaxID=2605694 RepID=A0ABT7PJC2_9BACT|nr:tRNA (guanosine(37)-N1)-methyltransferase TrmD [Roseiconus lacunae]MCD0458546.1 tRNA (guanosine(37)-N1)-methyltransferase TrmD [Roseiconus lacunae]MDM4016433.1 tRNA (guanosine(37)-N1)-methyltransferase TrmD [Roseiconus lacunae]WRQ51966.1 tRNA (guanosine(37)-N1)-methyltransferase TrmD [Stieleria sp. HD01]
MRFDIVTLFPAIFDGYLTQSLLEKAIQKQIVQIHRHDLRDWAADTPHRKVDDRPFGGGPGMLLQVDVTVPCVEDVQRMADKPARKILLTPQGKRFDQRMAEDFATDERLMLLCGRYEGFDQRVIDILEPEEVSIGDFVLNGGEVAAMTIIDGVVRLLPGVLGDENSNIDDSFSRGNRLLEFPQYTRPRDYRGHHVPEVLLSGNHEAIAKWRSEQSQIRTQQRRSDLLSD